MGYSVWDVESFINTILFLFLIILFISILFSVPRVYSGGVVSVGPSYISPYPVFSGPSILVNNTTVSGPSRAPRAPRAPRFRR